MAFLRDITYTMPAGGTVRVAMQGDFISMTEGAGPVTIKPDHSDPYTLEKGLTSNPGKFSYFVIENGDTAQTVTLYVGDDTDLRDARFSLANPAGDRYDTLPPVEFGGSEIELFGARFNDPAIDNSVDNQHVDYGKPGLSRNTVLMAAWVTVDAADPVIYQHVYSQDAAGWIYLRVNPNGDIEFRDTAAARFFVDKATARYEYGVPFHIAFSMDIRDANKRHVMVDGKLIADGDITWSQYVTTDQLDYMVHNLDVNGTGENTGTIGLNPGEIAQFFLTDEYYDLSQVANRDRLYKDGPVDIAGDGSSVTGTAPYYFLNGDHTNFGVNSGSGPDANLISNGPLHATQADVKTIVAAEILPLNRNRIVATIEAVDGDIYIGDSLAIRDSDGIKISAGATAEVKNTAPLFAYSPTVVTVKRLEEERG